MRPRDLTLVGLRLLAIWIACQTILQSRSLIDMIPLTQGIGGWTSWVHFQLSASVMEVAVMVVLFLLAPRLADWMCRDVSDVPFSVRMGSKDLHHIDCFTMGLWMLAQSIRPGVRVMAMLVFEGGATHRVDVQTAANLCESGMLLAFGLTLIFGSRGLSRFLSSLGHDPDCVPAQQFSLKLLLAVVIAAAVVLLVLRTLLLR